MSMGYILHLTMILGKLGTIWVWGSWTMPNTFWPFRPGLFTAFPRPPDRALHGQSLLLRRGVMRRALVEHHRNIGAEYSLDFHGLLRSDKQQ